MTRFQSPNFHSMLLRPELLQIKPPKHQALKNWHRRSESRNVLHATKSGRANLANVILTRNYSIKLFGTLCGELCGDLPGIRYNCILGRGDLLPPTNQASDTGHTPTLTNTPYLSPTPSAHAKNLFDSHPNSLPIYSLKFYQFFPIN